LRPAAEPGRPLAAGLTYLVVIVLTIVLSISAAGALECRAVPLKDGAYWQWRQISERRCWFPGRRKLEKSELHWESHPRPNSSAKGDGGETSRRITLAPAALPLYAEQQIPNFGAKDQQRFAWTDEFSALGAEDARPVRTIQYTPPRAIPWLFIISGACLATLLAAWGVFQFSDKSQRGGSR
jgi:hypothetical protein